MTSQDISTMRRLDEPQAGRLTIQYSPVTGSEIVENPPRFTWIPDIDPKADYTLMIKAVNGTEYIYKNIPVNFFVPPEVLPAGDYTWRYCLWTDDRQASEWSQAHGFSLRGDLPETPLKPRNSRFNEISESHPRLWLNRNNIETFRAALKKDPDHCGWKKFMKQSVTPWKDILPMKEPAPYPSGKRDAVTWRQTYIECQELIYAIRHQSIAGKIIEDDNLLANARDWLIAAAGWDPSGTTSRSYTDEWAFRVNLALAWGYDWLYDELTPDERNLVRMALLARTRQVADHCIENAQIHLFPFDSHAVRSVSAVLIPSCLALLGEESEAEDWLNYAIEFLYSVYSPWGDIDGGWAEGPHYWMTGMAYLIDAANILRSATGIDLYQRPFLQKTGDFPLFTKAPGTRRATFGDDSTMGDLPGFKLGYNMRQFASTTSNPTYQWYFEEVCRNDPGTAKEFYNWGWWDLNFDDLVYRHDYDPVAGLPLDDTDRLRWFRGIGWAAIQKAMDDPERHIQFVMKSSPWGSISHSHGDQNAFCLAAYGEDLAIQSGHYIGFNSSMHRNWRRQTISKNAILLNGKGQYAGSDKLAAMNASGKIVEAYEVHDHVFIRGDATAAYQSLSPEITKVLREVYFIHDSYFVIIDQIDAAEPVTLDWLFHANGPMELGSTTFRYDGIRAGIYGKFVWSESGHPEMTQVTGFPDVNPAEYVGLAQSTHLRAAFPSSKHHRMATLLVPYPASEPRRIFHFLDDQGYDCDMYFTDSEERSFKISIPKAL